MTLVSRLRASDDPRGVLSAGSFLFFLVPSCCFGCGPLFLLLLAAPPLTINGPGFLTRSFRFGTPCLLGPRRV